MRYKNGARYEGYWKNDQKDGLGKLEYPNGNIFVGQWKDDSREGFG